jgi:hypothetical protein
MTRTNVRKRRFRLRRRVGNFTGWSGWSDWSDIVARWPLLGVGGKYAGRWRDSLTRRIGLQYLEL